MIQFDVTGGGTRWSWCVCVLFVVFGISRLEALPPACELCVNRSASCSKQVTYSKLNDGDCKMIYYKLNGAECSSLALDGNSYSNVLGSVLLQSYIYTKDVVLRQTGFNVTFIDINWTSVTMRFMRHGHPELNMCREFHVSENFLSVNPRKIFYDCAFAKSDYEGQTYNFEYLASNSSSSDYRKYVFKVPQGKRNDIEKTKIKRWEVFTYVDITNLPFVILRCQTIPKLLNVTKYMVKTYSNDICVDESMLTANDDDVEIKYEWNCGILPGSHYFTVQPISTACGDAGCYVSKSPDIKIYSTFNLFYLGLALVAIILLALICLSLKFKVYIFPYRDAELPDKPTLLLIYRSTHSSHVKVVVELARYLRKRFNIHALVDELDVKSEDPFIWYNDAVAGADFIAVVSSPTCCESISGIYPNVYEAALCLLRGRRFNKCNSWKAYSLMVFQLPYCSEKSLPPETKNIGIRYKIPSQLNQVSNYVHDLREKGFLFKSYRWVKARVKIIWNLACNKTVDKKCHSLEIQAAIQEANAEVEKCVLKGKICELDGVVNVKSAERVNRTARDKYIATEHKNPIEMEESVLDRSSVDDFKPFQDFPGTLEDYDLLGTNVEKVETENSDKKTNFAALDNLIM